MRIPAAAILMVVAAHAAYGQDLGKPVRLEADGKPIDTEFGHAAPFVCDFDRDGKRDLLVGQFGDGKLKIFRNLGTNEAPRFAAATWFEAGGKVASIPAG